MAPTKKEPHAEERNEKEGVLGAMSDVAEKGVQAVQGAAEVAADAAQAADAVAEQVVASTKEAMPDIRIPRARKLRAFEGFFSVAFRIFALVFLRIFPSHVGFYAIQLYIGYVGLWLLYEVRCAHKKESARPSLRSLIFGYSIPNRMWNAVLLAGHTLLLLFVLDLYLAPYLFPSYRESSLRFARVGALSPTTATLQVRYPEPLPRLTGLWETGIQGQLTDAAGLNEAPLRVVWRHVQEQDNTIRKPSAVRDPRRWERGPVLHLSNETDWTTTATLTDLFPATKYEWRLAFVHNNTFAPMPARPIQFVTWPDPRLAAYGKSKYATSTKAKSGSSPVPLDDPNYFKFATFSCVKPDFPYHPAQFWGWNWLLRFFGIGTQPGGITLRNRIPGFDLMADHFVPHSNQPSSLRFILELGDLIYADVPRYEGPGLGAYRKLYRNLFASESFRRIYQSIPLMGIFDDHEIVNNWSGAGYQNESKPETALDDATTYAERPAGISTGLRAWFEYIGSANPTPAAPHEHYYSFRYGDSAFFVLDVRGHRTHPDSNVETHTMLGEKQRDALLTWLAQVNHTATFKFIASSVPFTTLWGGPLDFDGRTDGWSFYADERKHLLDVFQYVPNVILLTGDRHEFASVAFRDAVLEFSTSPLSMFYIPIRTLAQEHTIDPPGEEVLLKYLPDGNHKWTEFEVDTRDPNNPTILVRVQIDGKEAWHIRIHGQPVNKSQSALGKLAQSLMELFGFRKREWF